MTKSIPRAASSGKQGDSTNESHRSPTIEIHAMKARVKPDQSKKQKKKKKQGKCPLKWGDKETTPNLKERSNPSKGAK